MFTIQNIKGSNILFLTLRYTLKSFFLLVIKMSNNNEMKQLGYYLAGLIEGDGNI